MFFLLGFSEIIEKNALGPADPERYSDYARDIHQSGKHLLSLINDILDLSRIEAGRFELVPVELDLGEVIEDVCRYVALRAEQGGIGGRAARLRAASREAGGDDHHPVSLVRDVEHPSVHHVLIVVGKGRLAGIGSIREVIVRSAIKIEGRCQDERDLLPLFEAVNFTVDVEEKVALEGGAGGGNPVHPIECLPIRVEGRDLKNILE